MSFFFCTQLPKERILKLLNLEDTPPDNFAPSRLRDGRDREAYSLPAFSSHKFHAESTEAPSLQHVLQRVLFAFITCDFYLECQEFTLSARNGDKSRFNRERKQKIARRQRTRELLKGMAAERNLVDPSARVKARPVPA
jgi:hypothetical protein